MDEKSITKDSEYADTTISTAPDLEKNQPYPHRQHQRDRAVPRPLTIAPTLTIKHSPLDGERITRMNSTAARRDAARGDAGARTVANFRTLSIHVTDTQKGAATTASKKHTDKAVKGEHRESGKAISLLSPARPCDFGLSHNLHRGGRAALRHICKGRPRRRSSCTKAKKQWPECDQQASK